MPAPRGAMLDSSWSARHLCIEDGVIKLVNEQESWKLDSKHQQHSYKYKWVEYLYVSYEAHRQTIHRESALYAIIEYMLKSTNNSTVLTQSLVTVYFSF